jgi:hypothetical protein
LKSIWHSALSNEGEGGGGGGGKGGGEGSNVGSRGSTCEGGGRERLALAAKTHIFRKKNMFCLIFFLIVGSQQIPKKKTFDIWRPWCGALGEKIVDSVGRTDTHV